MQIIIFGPPGVGKGTQAKIISHELGIKHISTGDILREAFRAKSEIGLKAKEIMDRGELVPDEIMGKLVEEAINRPDSSHGFILDGFPRTLNQAKILEPILERTDFENFIFIQLSADDEIIVNRLSNRRVCTFCKSIVNLNLLDDITTCPNCGSKSSFEKRDDDDEKVIRNRLKVYRETTLPVLEYYRNRVKIISVDGIQPIHEITKNILSRLKTEHV